MEVPNAEFAKQVEKQPPSRRSSEGVSRQPSLSASAARGSAGVLHGIYHTSPPSQRTGVHESLAHSIRTIFLGFLISSLVGVPLGILCGTYRFFARLQEPFIEFFRYLPAPAFGALCVAILGIDDGPKIAIIVIGTFFQQVLVIANTVRKVDPDFWKPHRPLALEDCVWFGA